VTDLLQGETIIYFGPEPWAGLWRNRHQLMSRFARDNDVWYVEPPTMFRRLIGDLKNNNGHREIGGSRLVTRDDCGVNIFHGPWWLPITGRAPFKNLSIRIYMAVLFLRVRLRNSRRPIIWLSRPDMLDYLGMLRKKLTIYHVVDEYRGYGSQPNEQRTDVAPKEIEMLKRVDAAIVVTPTLLQLKSPYNPNTFLVPNAVDYASYASSDAQVPVDIADIHGPIIGYTGLIAARLDLQLLIEAAIARPDWSYVFVGSVNDNKCAEQIKQLRDLPNVHFLGQKPVDETPQYVKNFDVCTIPYVTNLRAQHASPLKVYEYAAAAKPIVATDFSAARTFDGHILIIRNTKEFINACEEALRIDPNSTEILGNREFAARNTWDHRVSQVSDIVRNCLNKVDLKQP